MKGVPFSLEGIGYLKGVPFLSKESKGLDLGGSSHPPVVTYAHTRRKDVATR